MSGYYKVFAFVFVESNDDARAIVKALNGRRVGNRQVKVEVWSK